MKKFLSIVSISLLISFSQLFAVTVLDESVSGVDRYAIYIGANDGGKGREKLLYAGSDALSFKNAMSEIGGVTESNSRVLIDPSKDSIDKALKEISEAINSKSGQTKRSEFIFYYSGHSDENALLLGNSKYDYSKLKAAITEVPSDIHVVILDSCYSGNFIRTKGGQKRKPFLIDDSSVVTGHAYLSSSSDNESSQESDEIESSYFTNAMITGLRGAADTSGDNKVTLNELYSYAFSDTLSKTETSKAGPQHPNYNITLVGSGDLILSDLTIADSMLSLSKDAKGRFIIRDSNDKLISEINKIAGQPIFIALPVGQYSALIIDEYSTKQGTFVLEKDQIFVLDQNTLGSIKRKSNRLRGDSEKILPELAESNDDNETLDIEDLDDIKSDNKKNPKHKVTVERIIANEENSQKNTTDTLPEIIEDDDEDLDLNFNADLSEFYGVDVSLFPGFSFIKPSTDTVNFSFGIFGAKSNNVYGLNISHLINISTGYVLGLQAAGIFNISTGNISGLQVAGVYNINKGVEGSQIGGVFNIAKKVDGAQIAGVYNLTDKTDGAQISGVANIAKKVDGAQISGVFNIARNIDGAQIGLINIAKENDGIAIGLLNFIQNGIFDLSLSINTNSMLDFCWKNGTYHLYNMLGGMIEWSDWRDERQSNRFIVYAGLGTQIPLGYGSFEMEFLWKFYFFNPKIYNDFDILMQDLPNNRKAEEISVPSFRVNWNFLKTRHAKLFISSSFDFFMNGHNDIAYDLFSTRWAFDTDSDLIVSPSIAIGVKINL